MIVGSTRPPPSGFSSFGSRLLKSAVKTVKGAFTSTMQISSPSKPKPTTVTGALPAQTGVGFGVPSGLGIGPANVPAPPKKVIPLRSNPLINKNRLPPAGPSSVGNRLRPALRSVSNTANYGTIAKRVLSSASTASEPAIRTLTRKGALPVNKLVQAAVKPIKPLTVARAPSPPPPPLTTGISVSKQPGASTSTRPGKLKSPRKAVQIRIPQVRTHLIPICAQI